MKVKMLQTVNIGDKEFVSEEAYDFTEDSEELNKILGAGWGVLIAELKAKVGAPENKQK